ncbi:Bcr/CflA subfamily drug resistance transporter [Thauera sp. 27]|uniref:multidrug effflux MFS transporter n=1 Tax=Thauera sp. 27 TaxID=305700 RepID=UPI0002CFEB1F|nr:multidrug effflux MFS transporter [Thauera sp. 27]ENO81513.1 Bcr/CflA subfamily drug resistance transporter [Thauera sp. 27]
MTIASASAPAMSGAFVVLALSLLLGIQPVTTDLYLPALPSLTHALGASVGQAQLTLSGLLLAFGCSQLVWGPVSDRFGRKPVLLLGLSIYTLAAVGSAFAGTIDTLLAWRLAQGAAMGAVVMCARALVRDLYAPEAGARAISKGLSGLGVIACLSIPLGGVVAELWGWRAALLTLAVFGGGTLVLIAMRFEETLACPDPRALRPSALLATWMGIVRHPQFIAFALLAMTTYAGLFTFLAASSFVFITLFGVTKVHYGLLMCLMALAYLVGTFLCRALLKRLGVQRTVVVGGALSLAGGGVMAVLAWSGVAGVWPIMLPMLLYMLGHGIHQPCGQAGAVGPFPHAAGAASALSGCLMMLSAFAVGQWLGASMDGSAQPMITGIGVSAAVTAAVAWGLVRRLRMQR